MSAAEHEIAPGVRWLSYAEAGAIFGIDPVSVKRRAQRHGWARQPGNDGKTRVAVPPEAFPAPDDSPAAVPRHAAEALPPPPAGFPELAALLAESQAGERQARELADRRGAELAALRLELERTRQATAEPVAFPIRQAPPRGYRIERLRAGDTYQWRRLADGARGEGHATKWSAWRAAHGVARRAREGEAGA